MNKVQANQNKGTQITEKIQASLTIWINIHEFCHFLFRREASFNLKGFS